VASHMLLLSNHNSKDSSGQAYLTLTYANVEKGHGNKDKFFYSSTTVECIVNGTYHDMGITTPSNQFSYFIILKK
jgi:hypothetical protein